MDTISHNVYPAFQAETWVDLKWCAHNDLCKLNVIYYEIIGDDSKIIVSCFLFDRKKKWPNTKIFLCLWHVAWQKRTCIKIKDVVVQAKVLKNMGCIIHDTMQPNGTPLDFAKEELVKLMEMILNAQTFWSYIISE
jgi:hypothetical protein